MTKEVFKILDERKREFMALLANGMALVQPDNAVIVGRYREILDLEQMTYEEMQNPKETM